MKPLYRWTLDQCRGHRYLAAGITTTLVTLIVLLPIGLAATTATLEGLSLIDELQLADVRQRLGQLRHDFGLEIPYEPDVRHLEVTLRAWRQKQRGGEPLEVQAVQVENLLQRVGHIQNDLQNNRLTLRWSPTPSSSERSSSALRSAADSVERDEAASTRKPNSAISSASSWGARIAHGSPSWPIRADDQLDHLRQTVLASSAPVLSLGSDTVIFVLKLALGTLIMMVGLFFLLAEGPGMLEGLIKIRRWRNSTFASWPPNLTSPAGRLFRPPYCRPLFRGCWRGSAFISADCEARCFAHAADNGPGTCPVHRRGSRLGPRFAVPLFLPGQRLGRYRTGDLWHAGHFHGR